ncbi:hypothetical protein LguiB_009284 [Lonicera macranthoides]
MNRKNAVAQGKEMLKILESLPLCALLSNKASSHERAFVEKESIYSSNTSQIFLLAFNQVLLSMVYLGDSRLYYTPSHSSTKLHPSTGRSMRTIHSNIYQFDRSRSFNGSTIENFVCLSKNLTDSVIDLRLDQLASRPNNSAKSSFTDEDFFDIS